MMTKLREMTFIFIWILVIAFVGLMVFEWGMDFTGRRTRSNVVGQIEGQNITIQEFQQALQNAYMQEKQMTGQEPDENRMAQLRDQVWEMYIQRVLFSKEIQKRGIEVTDKEIYLQMTQNPPQEIRQNPNFQTNGQFDMKKYQQALQNPEVNWLPVENYYREILPFQKLQEIINSSVIVTEEEIRSAFIDQNQKAKISYLAVPVSAFAKDSVSVTDAETRAYYENHKEDFKVDEKRQLNYVLFSTAPTAEDSTRIYQLAEDVKKEALSGEDFSKLADEYSEDPSVRTNHGDLGFFKKSAMVKPFADAAFSAKPGEIVGPVKTQFGLHIIKVIAKKKVNGEEEVNAAHILFKFSASPLTVENAQNAANNFKEVAKDAGFAHAAQQLNVPMQQTPEFANGSFIPGIGNITMAMEWTFSTKKNEISSVYRTPQGYTVLELANISPAGYRPFEEVQNICKSRVEFNKHKEMAKNFAEQIQSELNQNETFAQIAKKNPTVAMDSTGEFTLTQPIPKIGRVPEVSAAAFSLNPGVVSPMLDTNRGYYFVKVLNRTPFNEELYKQQRDQIRNRLLAQKTQEFFTEWYNRLKENANIKDYRNQFFAS
ncbi:MAG: peptidylprolyl isomerase [Calditrichia bacterium]